MSIQFECWRTPIDSKSSKASVTHFSACRIGSKSLWASVGWTRDEMGKEGWIHGVDEEVSMLGKILALCQQFCIIIVYTSFHALFASFMASS